MVEPFAEWKDEYAIGNVVIDEQHKAMVELINDLHAGLSLNTQTDRTEAFRDAVGKSVKYVKNHFTTEEEYMIRIGYPGLPDQQEMHKAFIVELLTKVKEYENNNKRAPVDFLIFLKEWLLEHVAVEDRKIGHFTAEQTSG